jgi:hypothetical protein
MTELNRIYLEDCLDRIGLIETTAARPDPARNQTELF